MELFGDSLQLLVLDSARLVVERAFIKSSRKLKLVT